MGTGEEVSAPQELEHLGNVKGYNRTKMREGWKRKYNK